MHADHSDADFLSGDLKGNLFLNNTTPMLHTGMLCDVDCPARDFANRLLFQSLQSVIAYYIMMCFFILNDCSHSFIRAQSSSA